MNGPRLDAEALGRIAAQTVAHYEQRAEAFREGTRDHDVSQNVAALLRHIAGPAPFTILDLGCGPGRDLQTFKDLGHVAIGLDGCAAFRRDGAHADAAAKYGDRTCWRWPFRPDAFTASSRTQCCSTCRARSCRACSRQLFDALLPGGVLFSSNPRGDNVEGWNQGRYGAWHDLAGWRRFVSAAGFVELEHYYRPAGLPREEQQWLATVWRRPD